MKYTEETEFYNEKRYGKPWIAVVDFTENKKGSFIFGDWIGQPGSEGLLEIDCNAGDIIAKGQKDFRKSKNSAPDFYIIDAVGNLDRVSKKEAYQHAVSGPDKSDLISEKEQLLKRINEIDTILKQ